MEATRNLGSRADASDGPGARGWDGLFVLCAANGYDGIKLADQHMAESLSKLVPVLYVEPPLSPLTWIRNREAISALRAPRLRIQAPGLARLTPVVQPGPSRRGMADLTSALTRRYLHWAVSQLGGRVRAVVSAWPQYPVFGSCGEQVAMYWAQDDFVGGAELLGWDARQLDIRERRVAASASIIMAANTVVADKWRQRGHDSVLIPFGADVTAFSAVEQAPLPPDVELKGPIVGCVGHLNDRIDLRLLEAIADRGRSLLLVGPRNPAFEPQRFDALLQRDNVCWVGPKPFRELPSYLRMMDVGIVPYGDSPFNRSSFPLKTLEYLAAGRGVVATDLPATRWLATDLIAVASDPGPFADQVDHALAERVTPALLASRRAFAAEHSWARRAAELRETVAAQVTAPASA